jgi:hypothetical protein
MFNINIKDNEFGQEIKRKEIFTSISEKKVKRNFHFHKS